MPTSLTFDQHVDALQASGQRLLAAATAAGLEAPVPTCPTWTVRALVAHQVMVHRWATAHVRGDDPDAGPNQTWIRSNIVDLPRYYREGLAQLVSSLRAAPADLVALRFLNDAPPAREFWARRQAHETTIHMVDTCWPLCRRPGRRRRRSGSTLRWRWTGSTSCCAGSSPGGSRSCTTDRRARSRWRAPTSTGAGCCAWGPTLSVMPGRGEAADARADATLTGSAAGLYLALWNRGDDVTLAGRPGVLDRWRATQRVRWS